MPAPFADDQPLGEVRAAMLDHVYPLSPTTGERELGGTMDCPACGRRVQVHKWGPYATAIKLLGALWRAGGTTEFIKTSDLDVGGHGDGSRLRYFRLVEQESERRPDGGKADRWRVTQLGEDWLFGRTTIQGYVHVFNNKVLKRFGPQISVREAVKKKFDFDEFMSGLM